MKSEQIALPGQSMHTRGEVLMPRQLWLRSLVCLALFLLTFCTYGRIWIEDFQFLNADDDQYVTDNPHVNTGLNRENVAWAVTAFHSSNWHPLTWISLQLDAEIFGPSPRAFHVTNVFLHATNAVLLLLVLSRITGAFWRSFAVAGLFAVHPLHVESVAWVAERKDVLSGLFFMLTLWAYASYADRPTWGRYLLVLLPFALGLTAKQMLVTVPCLLLVLDYWPIRRSTSVSWRRLSAEKLPLLALAAGISLLTIKAQTGLIQSTETFPLTDRIANAVVSYVDYLRTTFWPTELAFWYTLHSKDLTWSRVGGAAVVLAIISATALAQRNRRPYFLVGWLWFLGMLVPVIGLVQLSNQARGDRYTYLPLIGFFVLLVWAIHEWQVRRWVRPVLGAVLMSSLGFCSVATWNQSGYWRNSKAMWERSLAVAQDNGGAHLGLAIALENDGDAELAEQHYLKAVELLGDATSFASLGTFRIHQGNLEDAHRQFERAAALDPHNSSIQFKLAMIALYEGNPVEARQLLEKVVEEAPGFAEGHYLHALVLSQLGELDKSVAEMTKAVLLNPPNADAHYELGKLLLRQGDLDFAWDQFDIALQRRPSYALAHVGKGAIMARYGDEQSALEYFEQALTADPRNAEAHYLVGASLHNRGNRAEARSHFETAVKSNPNLADARLALGEALLHEGQLNEAAIHLAAAVRLNPRWAPAHASLAFAMARLGKSAEAVAAFKMAAQLEPGFSHRHRELALALADDGQKEQAAKEYREATQLEPGWVESARNAAWELLKRKQQQPGYNFVALRLARQAYGGAGQPTTELLDTLAAAYAEVGSYEEAVEIARQALLLAGIGKKELAGQIQGRLVNYERHQPIPKE